MALAQDGVDPLPGAVTAPLGVVVEDRRPGREVVRQGTPLAAQGCSTLWNAEEVEEAVEPADSGAEAVLSE